MGSLQKFTQSTTIKIQNPACGPTLKLQHLQHLPCSGTSKKLHQLLGSENHPSKSTKIHGNLIPCTFKKTSIAVQFWWIFQLSLAFKEASSLQFGPVGVWLSWSFFPVNVAYEASHLSTNHKYRMRGRHQPVICILWFFFGA